MNKIKRIIISWSHAVLFLALKIVIQIRTRTQKTEFSQLFVFRLDAQQNFQQLNEIFLTLNAIFK